VCRLVLPRSSQFNFRFPLQVSHVLMLIVGLPLHHLQSTLLTVVSSSNFFLPLVLIMHPHFHPACSCLWWQFGVLLWCPFDPAINHPVVHSVSRGLQQWCGHRGCCLMFQQLGEFAMWRGVLTSWSSHLPGLPDTIYAAPHLMCVRRRGWVGWDSLLSKSYNLKKSKKSVVN
jgi:hypothetical protein